MTTMTTRRPGRRRSRGRTAYYRQVTGLLFVLPCVLYVGVFFILPVFTTAWMSLHDWPLLGAKKFAGCR
jgi:multiple sugar transport system permease protein